MKFYWVITFLLLGFIALVLPGMNIQQPVLALNNGLALTPPMGWNSWNIFGGNIDETKIKQIADAMVSSGMKNAGYIYLNLDDNWMANPARDANGNLRADPTRFPSGIKALADYVHSKGLKLGIYSDRGTMTCMGIPQSGGHGHEQQDANTYASWGVDYLKYDNCNADSDIQADYERMRDALANCGRPIVYSICAWQFLSWMPNTGNLWRTTGDINASWSSILSIIDTNAGLAAYAGPGHWNDPDMLEVGNGSLTIDQNKAHFSLWCIMAAPLICGNDIRSMSSTISGILTNSEAIAVDQDPAGIQGTKVQVNGSQEVWCKPLGSSNGNTKAIALLNRSTSSSANITVNWSSVGLTGSVTVRDLWTHLDLGSFNSSYTANVPAGGVVLLKVVGTPIAQNSFEGESGTLSGAAVIANASYCSGGAKVGYIGNGSANYVTINNINVTTAGTYTMTIYYVLNGNRSFFVGVNGGAGIEIPLTGSDWSALATPYQMSVYFNVGTNSIKFYNNSAYAPDLDRIVISGGPSSGFNGTYKIINRLSGMGLNVPNGSTSQGTQLIQYPFGGGNHEKWIVIPNNDSYGSYSIKNVNSSQLADVSGASVSNGAAIIQWPNNGGNNQKWQIISIGSGYYKIISVLSGKAMVVQNASASANALIIQWDYNASHNDEWQLLAP